MTKKSPFVLLFLLVAMSLFFCHEANAAVAIITITSNSSGSQSQIFSVPAGFTSVKIISGYVDDRGPISINGTLVLFQCSSWLDCADYGDNGSWTYIVPAANAPVPSTNACNPADAASFPVDITSLVVAGDNTLSVIVDNCGGGPAGFDFTVEITTDPCTDATAPACNTPGACQINPGWCDSSSGAAVCYYPVDSAGCDIDGDSCTLDICTTNDNGFSGTCIAGFNTCGGLVPCGRMINNLGTPWNETQSCNMCHFVILTHNIINFLMELIILISILALIIAGLIYVKTGGDSSLITAAKQNVNKILYGFVIVFATWVIVNLAMILFGFDDPLGDGSWHKFNCEVDTSFCGDGVANGTEACDGTDLNEKSCVDFGSGGGILTCDAKCSFNTSLCCFFVTTTINVNQGSPVFNIPADFTSVKIISGYVDDRGPTSINGIPVLFQCSSWLNCADYGDNGSWTYIVPAANAPVPLTNACSLADAIPFPIDITSFVNVGNNTMSAIVDNCGGGPAGFNFNIEITTCVP